MWGPPVEAVLVVAVLLPRGNGARQPLVVLVAPVSAQPAHNLRYAVQGSGFRVQGSGFGVQGSGVRGQGSGCVWHQCPRSPPITCVTRFRVQESGFRVQESGFRVQGSGFRVQGHVSGFRVQESGFRV